MCPTADERQTSAAQGHAATVTGSDLVVEAVRNAGGSMPRLGVLDHVARTRGRRDAGMAIAIALLAGRVRCVVLDDGRIGLTIAEAQP